MIRPEHFEKKLMVPEPNNMIFIELDWTKYPDVFKQTAEDVQICLSSFAIIICKEGYPKELWATKEENADLYAAQMILKMVRDAMGHMSAQSTEISQPRWTINEKNRELLEVKSIGVSLDARILNGQPFRFSHLGGLKKFLDVLSYLERDLQNKMTLETVSTNNALF